MAAEKRGSQQGRSGRRIAFRSPAQTLRVLHHLGRTREVVTRVTLPLPS